MTFYTIALNFEDGVTRFVDCKQGEKVLDAAFRNKINLPMDCSDGVCGTCKCRAESGAYDLGSDFIEDALTEDEIKDKVKVLKRASKAEVLTASGVTGKGVDQVLYRVLQTLDEAKAERTQTARKQVEPHWTP